MLDHLPDLFGIAPFYRPKLDLFFLIQRVKLDVMKIVLESVFSKPDSFFRLRQPIHFKWYEMKYSSKNRSDILRLQVVIEFSKDLQSEEWQ